MKQSSEIKLVAFRQRESAKFVATDMPASRRALEKRSSVFWINKENAGGDLRCGVFGPRGKNATSTRLRSFGALYLRIHLRFGIRYSQMPSNSQNSLTRCYRRSRRNIRWLRQLLFRWNPRCFAFRSTRTTKRRPAVP